MTKPRAAATLAVLFGLNFMNFYDRQVVGAIAERLKTDWQLTDGQLGGLTTAFILLYAVVGIPLGRMADRGRRPLILGAGALVWSGFTALSGLATGFASLFLCRMGVGVGEASCAPAANSLLGDLFPASQRGRAIALFMLGLPLGLGASFLFSGILIEATGGWRPALYVAAIPGALLGLLALRLPEPARGAAEGAIVPGGSGDPGAIRAILRIPTMRWIILSGALININMYALGGFLVSYMIRYHGLGIGAANTMVSVAYGFGGGLGMLAGGWLGDRVARNGAEHRLRLASAAFLLAVPFALLALGQGRGEATAFVALILPACFLQYSYYSTVYASIQEVVEPSRRGTAMAVYFLAFYFATAIGLYLFGKLSDRLAAVAQAAGAAAADARATGLHGAMYVIPAIALAVAAVLWIGSRTLPADAARMRHGTAA